MYVGRLKYVGKYFFLVASFFYWPITSNICTLNVCNA
jgi:hypothetical protein